MKEIDLYVCGGFIKAWHGDAVALSNVSGYKVTTPYWANNDHLLQCAFPNYVFKKNFEKLITNGFKIRLWLGKIKDHNLIGIFEELEDIQYIQYDRFSFTNNTDFAMDNPQFDTTIIYYNVSNGFLSEPSKEYCMNLLTVFGDELQFVINENNIEEYWRNKKEAIRKVVVTSKNATNLIEDLDNALMYGSIDTHFEIFRRRLLKSRKFANFEENENIIKFYNLLYYGIENETSTKKRNLVARMLFCNIIDNKYDETIRAVFMTPEKFYNTNSDSDDLGNEKQNGANSVKQVDKDIIEAKKQVTEVKYGPDYGKIIHRDISRNGIHTTFPEFGVTIQRDTRHNGIHTTFSDFDDLPF